MYALFVLLKRQVCRSDVKTILSAKRIFQYLNVQHVVSHLHRIILRRMKLPDFTNRMIIYHTATLQKVFPISCTGWQETLCFRKKRRLIENITGLKQGTILDIGSGTGYFAGTMKKAGWLVKGIEINEKARNFSISQFELEYFNSG